MNLIKDIDAFDHQIFDHEELILLACGIFTGAGVLIRILRSRIAESSRLGLRQSPTAPRALLYVKARLIAEASPAKALA